MRHFLFTVFLSLYCLSAMAGTLKGKVTGVNGGALPYATIVVEGTTTGVTTNGNGDYELSLAPGLYKVVCQYVGYKPSRHNVSIVGDETVHHNFAMVSEALEMKEVVIRASTEDPAYPIIRNAIKRRRFHLDQVKSFQTGIYFKGVARSRSLPDKFMGEKIKSADMGLDSAGKGVLYLVEEDAEYFSDGTKEKTVIHSVHESGDKNGFGFPRFPPVTTFYENNVNILGNSNRGFISPVSENALLYYKYKLQGEITGDGNTIYKIQVTPRRAYEPCFTGTIYIVDSDWAIHSLDMMLAKQSGMDLIDTLKISQLFVPKEKDTWVIKSQVLYFTIKFLAFDITANGVTVYDGQKVNESIPDSIFAGKVTSKYDKTANKKDTAYWQSRPVPLADDEKRDFVVKDSIYQKTNTPEYLDSIRRKGNNFKLQDLLINGYSYRSRRNTNTYTINPVLLSLNDNIVNYNIVEGFNAAPKFSLKHNLDSAGDHYWRFDGAIRYGFSNTHFNGIGRIYGYSRDKEWLNRSWLYGVEGGKYVFQYNPDNPVIPFYNTYAALFARRNDLKIYERWDASAFLRRNYGNGLSWFVKASFQQRLPLQNTTTYSVTRGDESGFASNTPATLLAAATAWEQHNAALVYGSISFKPGFTYTEYPDFKIANSSAWPRFTLHYQKGIPDILDSKTDFDKWRFTIQDNLSLKLLGSFNYMVATGGFLNTNYVSIPDLHHLYGNRGIGLASPYLQSFQFAQFYEFSNKAALYGEAHAEYHMRGLLTNKIPLLRQLRYYLVVGGNAFYSGNNLYYTEAFVGLENIGWKLVRVLRVDFVQSWDSNMGRNSGIRVGIGSPNVSVSRSNPTNSEW
jgi:hypothetical protein